MLGQHESYSSGHLHELLNGHHEPTYVNNNVTLQRHDTNQPQQPSRRINLSEIIRRHPQLFPQFPTKGVPPQLDIDRLLQEQMLTMPSPPADSNPEGIMADAEVREHMEEEWRVCGNTFDRVLAILHLLVLVAATGTYVVYSRYQADRVVDDW